MTGVRAVLVSIPADRWDATFRRLTRDADRALATPCLPGDTLPEERYTHLASAVEAQAVRILDDEGSTMQWCGHVPDWFAASSGGRPWLTPDAEQPTGREPVARWVAEQLDAGAGVVVVSTRPAPWTERDDPPGPPPPASMVSRDVASGGRKQATAARLGDEVVQRGHPLRPDGVPNDVLTEGLRALAVASPVPVIYRDGSETGPFPHVRLRELADDVDPDWPVVRLALISMRHPEMDAFVDGALLRNEDISRGVARAHVEAVAHQEARTTLRALADNGDGGVHVHLHQTGLEAAVVGTYRAVLDLLAEGAPLAVTPRYHAGGHRTTGGHPWVR